MSDKDDITLDEGEGEQTEGQQKKKGSGLKALLPKLLKWVAFGLILLILIVTVSFVTYSIMQRGGRSQTGAGLAETDPYSGTKPTYQYFSSIGTVRTRTNDATPYTVSVEMQLGLDENDRTAQTELTTRLPELKDFIRSYFTEKSAADLQPQNEMKLKQEIVERLNTRILNSARVRSVIFITLDIMETGQ
jgi:flagellar FliL protein